MKLELTDPHPEAAAHSTHEMDILLEIYGSTREKEMEKFALVGSHEKEFIASQFRAQHEYYQKNYIGADFWIIEKEGKTVGRLCFHHHYQGQGMLDH